MPDRKTDAASLSSMREAMVKVGSKHLGCDLIDVYRSGDSRHARCSCGTFISIGDKAAGIATPTGKGAMTE